MTLKIHPKQISIKDFTYELQSERIAQFPLENRDESKLLVYGDGKILQDVFKNLSAYITNNSLMIFNDTKVVNARLYFRNSNGAKIEIFCLEPCNEKEIQHEFQKTGLVRWKCIIGNSKAWKNEKLKYNSDEIELSASMQSKENEIVIVEFSWKPAELGFAEILERLGTVPLPPYMKRDAVDSDKITYQTIYARIDGSVAAPTAGLHFSRNVLDTLKQKQIDFEKVTLHVGAGTFKPVKSATMGEHDMHYETFIVKKQTVEQLLNFRGKNIVAVGTTSLRTIESLYWLGAEIINGRLKEKIVISQWMPYETDFHYEPEKVLKKILEWMNKNSLDYLYGRTGLMIAPGYDLKIVNTLITNFHQPKSTLLLLVAAFVGNDWRWIYDYALNNDFRFLSYGDASIFYKK